ncbi:MAG: gamma-glutamylcyclotransferase [Candidatus Lambdaproteobacteria bacterium]|nr:gamma-glutamylcyclotransferase [Candidatus Lambdaproteobacteria bacterium]
MAPHELTYFAYGSNLNLQQMRERCPGAQHLMRAVLPGFRLAFVWQSKRWNGAGVASILPDPAASVPGLLYEMTEDDVARLHGFEGVPNAYYPHAIEVVRGDGLTVPAYTYRHAQHSANPPAKGYFDIIWRGYRHFGLGEETLFQAARAATVKA